MSRKTKKPTAPTRNQTFDAVADLRQKCADLIEIVEGVRSVRWSCDGMRLKDTPEWAAFYVSVHRG